MAVKKKSNSSKKTAATKARPIQAYAFVDTNIFLDFYRTGNEASLSLLEKLKVVKDRILSTYQVEMEFLKNRQTTLLTAIQGFSAQVSSGVPAVLSDDKVQAALKSLKKDANKKKIQLEKRVSAILENPRANDRVYGVLAEIFTSTAGHVLTRDMKVRQQIKRLAWKRFILGYPPRKGSDTSIGDALNWEWIVHCSQTLRGRIYIVTRDGDYGCELNGKYYLNDQLKAEFRDRVGNKSIVFTKRLSEALGALEVHVSREEKQAEDSALATSPYTPDIATAFTGYYPPDLAAAMKGFQMPDITAALKGFQMSNFGSEIQAAIKAAQFADIGSEMRKAMEQSKGIAEQIREATEALRAAQTIQKPKED